MTITYNGANSVVIQTKNSSIVTDPFSSKMGNFPKIKQDIVLLTDTETTDTSTVSDEFVIDGPGEYEIMNNSIMGIPAKRHIDTEGLNSTIYTIRSEGISVVFFGHIAGPLSEEQLESIGVVDIAIIPVGGNGYTLDAIAATQIIKDIEPKIVVPVHYESSKVTYEVPQANTDLFLKELGITEPVKDDKLKLKDSQIPENLTAYLLTES